MSQLPEIQRTSGRIARPASAIAEMLGANVDHKWAEVIMRSCIGMLLVIFGCSTVHGQATPEPAGLLEDPAPEPAEELGEPIPDPSVVLIERIAALEELQRKAIEKIHQEMATDTKAIVEALDGHKKQLDSIYKEVDKSPINELWFAFVSDRVTNALNSILGLESRPSTPLWAAGILSLGLILLKALVFFLHRTNADGTAAKVLGRSFTVLVTLYLIVLTGSLLMLAVNAPTSPIEKYTSQIEESERLIEELQTSSAKMTALLERVKASGVQVVVEPPAAVVSPEIERIHSDVISIKQEMQKVKAKQHGGLWTVFVALGAFCSICLGVYLVHENAG